MPPVLSSIQAPIRQRLHLRWAYVRDSLAILKDRIVALRLAQTAGSLTFSTVLSLVPLLAIGLAVMTAFPVFTKMRDVVQSMFVQNLLPEVVGSTILRYLNQFAAKATTLSAIGIALLVGTATTMLVTLERTLNEIWQVKPRRPLARRLLMYWSVLTLGPVLLGAGLSLSSQLFSLASEVMGLSAWRTVALTCFGLASMTVGFAVLYRLVPEYPVAWRDALLAGLIVTVAFEFAKQGFGGFIASAPTYRTVYGTLAALPMFFLWLYLSWAIVLIGAVIAATLPDWRLRVRRVPEVPGARLIEALLVLQRLQQARDQAPEASVGETDLQADLGLDRAGLRRALDTLRGLNWAAPIESTGEDRWVMLAHPDQIVMAELLRATLFDAAALGADDRAKALSQWMLAGLKPMSEQHLRRLTTAV